MFLGLLSLGGPSRFLVLGLRMSWWNVVREPSWNFGQGPVTVETGNPVWVLLQSRQREQHNWDCAGSNCPIRGKVWPPQTSRQRRLQEPPNGTNASVTCTCRGPGVEITKDADLMGHLMTFVYQGRILLVMGDFNATKIIRQLGQPRKAVTEKTIVSCVISP